jgi:hypothetical protein
MISVIKFTQQFIRSETKIALEDTLILANLDAKFRKYSFFSESATSFLLLSLINITL